MSAAGTGPLFTSPPVQSAVDWLRLLPILTALPGAAILIWGLARGRLSPPMAIAGLVLPAVAHGLGVLLVIEESKNVRFCGSCHVMAGIVQSLAAPGRGCRLGYDPEGAAAGRVKENVAPGPSLGSAQSRPPWASMIERLIANPKPMPCGFVV